MYSLFFLPSYNDYFFTATRNYRSKSVPTDSLPIHTHSFKTKMKFTAAAVLSILSAGGGASAFSPSGFVSSKSGLLVPTSAQDDSNSPFLVTPRTPMEMVAGGAERAYGQEYYEGMFHISCRAVRLGSNRSPKVPLTTYFVFSLRRLIRCSDRSPSGSSIAVVAQPYRLHWYAFGSCCH